MQLFCDWKKKNNSFKVWRRFAQNSKAERYVPFPFLQVLSPPFIPPPPSVLLISLPPPPNREANQFASRAKEEQRNLDKATRYRDHRVTLRCFLIWRSRAKLKGIYKKIKKLISFKLLNSVKGEERQTQLQHEIRKQQMAQFLLRAKQLPNTEGRPAPPSPTSPTAKIAKPVAKRLAAQKGSPIPQPTSPMSKPSPIKYPTREERHVSRTSIGKGGKRGRGEER